MADDPPSIEAAARVLAAWLGHAQVGQHDRDISPEFPDWCFDGAGNLKMQGGKPALLRVAAAMLAAAQGAATGQPPTATFPPGAGLDGAALLLQALECYRNRNGTMRLCADYPTARCSATDCVRTGCAKVHQFMRGVVPRGDASDG